MKLRVHYARFPFELKADDGLVVGYANKAIVDDGNDFIPAEVWFNALKAFFREGMPVKLLHRPSLTVGKTVWLKITHDGLILASKPLFPEIAGLIQKGVLRAYSVGFIPRKYEYRSDGVRVIKELDLIEVSYVDEPMNRGCFFFKKMNMGNKEVVFDADRGVVSILGVTPEEMGELAEAVKELLVKAGVEDPAKLTAIEFKAAQPPAQPPASEEKAEEEELPEYEEVDWNEVFDNYYALLEGKELPEEKVRWTRRYINRLPDSSFAVIEPAYERGETRNKDCRHLPHHGPGGGGTKNVNLDLPHLRNAFARASLIKPVTDSISAEELRRRAMEHLEHHRSALTTEQEKSEPEKGERKGLLGRVQELLGLVRGETEAAEQPEEKANNEALKSLESKVQGIEEKLAGIVDLIKVHEGELSELRRALEGLTDVVQGLVPPRKSTPVTDPTGERNNQYKWGLFRWT